MGRQVGGGFRMGNTCTPMADSCQCMAKPIQYTNAYIWNLEMTLYARQQKKHRCIEQSFGLCGRGRQEDDLGEWH